MGNHKKYHLGIKGLIKNKKGEILLLLKNVNRTMPYGQDSYWDIPGGRIEEGSTIKETLEREIKEETGIESFQNNGLFYAVVSNIEIKEERCGLILFVYICVPIGKYEIKLDDEHTEYGWFRTNKAAQLLSVKYPSDFIEKLKQ